MLIKEFFVILRATPPFKCWRIFCGVFSLFLPFLGAHHYRTGKNSPFSRKPNVFGNLRALSAKCDLRTRSKLFQNNHLRVAKSHFCLSAHDLRASAYAERVNARDFYNRERKKTQGIPKKICAAKIFWEEEQQVYISKRRIAARKNYLVATSAERKPDTKRKWYVGLSLDSSDFFHLF